MVGSEGWMDRVYETQFHVCDPTDEGVVVEVLALRLAVAGWVLVGTKVKKSGLLRAEFRRVRRGRVRARSGQALSGR